MNTIVNHKITKKLAAAVIAMFCLAAITAVETVDISTLSFLDASGAGWSYSSNFLTIQNGADVEITGNNSSCNIRISASATANITLNNANAQNITLQSGANATLTLTGSNSFTSMSGLLSNEININGSGSLTMPDCIGTFNVQNGTLNIAGNLNGNLTVSGGNVNITGNVTGTTTHNSGYLNGFDQYGNPVSGSGGFGPVPNTGLPDITLYTFLMFFFGGVSILLWGHVLYCKFFGKKG